MKSILAQLSSHVSTAIVTAFGEDGRDVDPIIRAATDPKFGDYQSNVAMGFAKRLGKKPRDVAQAICDALTASKEDGGKNATEPFGAMCEPPQIAGPGFINLTLKADFVAQSLGTVPPAPKDDTSEGQDRLGINPVNEATRDTVVIDYSSPNVAKQMHVGHLRSTVIGDTIARVLEFEGHEVIRQNHIGDWGTQFGIILAELRERGLGFSNALDAGICRLLEGGPGELEKVYRAGNTKMSDPVFSKKARAAVVALQTSGGHPSASRVPRTTDQWIPTPSDVCHSGTIWKQVIEVSMWSVYDLYRRLGVSLTEIDVCGESFYNPLLAAVIEELRAALPERATDQSRDRKGAVDVQKECRAICRKDQGALCVFLENPDGTPAFKTRDGDPQPMLVQKSDGASLYSTTDIAAILYRISHTQKHPFKLNTPRLREELDKLGGGLGGTRILYVVGSPQKLHFQMLFATINALGWTMPKNRTTPIRLEHVMFGSVLGPDRKMLKTRTGENVKLKDLLDEAVSRAGALVRKTEEDPDKKRDFNDGEIKHIAETVGIASVKYADLSQNRNTDYMFNWDKMLALQGNTAPYMLYAYARIQSIYRKGNEAGGLGMGLAETEIRIEHKAERALAVRILQLPETLDLITDTLLPNLLCDYLFDLAGRFMTFYEACPVIQAPDDATRASRLRLCDLTARALRLGLGLLGIHTLDRM